MARKERATDINKCTRHYIHITKYRNAERQRDVNQQRTT